MAEPDAAPGQSVTSASETGGAAETEATEPVTVDPVVAEPAAAKPVAAAGAEEAPEGKDPSERGARKVREGTVVSDKMQTTVIVAVTERVRHAKYGKTVQRTKRLYAHDLFESHVGDRVRIAETRPLSKLKRWRVTEVLERAR
jgi:small subunit ribosomal protein S17